ncbi:hypothetical protein BSKO_00312 [Bryopsis sp. KO-2023]|nr:hypothetical protein BSKO_00312 [Bryopsis sp. KO-2023]
MEVDTSRQVKRKRSPDPLPMKKRKAYISQALECAETDAPDGGFNEREEIRGEVRVIYEAYVVLSSGGGDREKRVECLDLILDGVRGSTAGKRLAARLIPKFMGEFRESFPRAVDCLLELCAEGPVGESSHQAIVDSLRMDVLEGLGVVCDKAASFTDRPDEILGKVVHCVLRQLVRAHRPPHSGPSSNGVSTRPKDINLMLGSCEKAFRVIPREFLSQCLSAWREGDGTASAGATMVFEKLLLSDRISMSDCSYGSRRYEHSNGSRAPLAVEVLSKHPETMRWLSQTVYGLMQEAGSCQRSYHHLLDELMQKLPPQQKSYTENEQRHRTGTTLHGARHGAPSSLHPPHLQTRTLESESKIMPRTSSGFSRPPADSGIFQPQWNSETAHLMPTTVLPRHDDGPCLWFAALPHPLRKENLGPICSQYGTVDAIIFPSAPCHDKALVIFRSPREASLCCHHILNNPVLSGGRRICATVPAAGNPCHLLDPISTCVWVGGAPSHDQERDVLNSLHNANLPPPRHIIVVNGACPGFLLELQFISMVTPSLDCLEPIDKQNYSQEPCPPPPTNPSQVESRPGHSRAQETTWKAGRGGTQPNPMLPPGNWGTQATDGSNRSPRHFPQPPPPRQPPPPLPESSVPGSPPPPPPPLASANPDKAADRWGGHENGSSFDRSHRRFERDSTTPQARRPYWSGNLAKSGVTMCRLVCWQNSENCVAGLSGREPLEWPDVLDVRLRVDINTALKPVHGTQDRVLLRLSAGNSSNDHSKLKEFIKYLTDRTRAGVVHLRGSSSGGKGDRTMFLIPPTESAAKSLGIEVMSNDSLIVLVVPGRGRR